VLLLKSVAAAQRNSFEGEADTNSVNIPTPTAAGYCVECINLNLSCQTVESESLLSASMPAPPKGIRQRMATRVEFRHVRGVWPLAAAPPVSAVDTGPKEANDIATAGFRALRCGNGRLFPRTRSGASYPGSFTRIRSGA
jgi:hypothetical protein